ncbi:YjbE family putative metal transport protein [Caulobacter sp. 17J65-9]|uniref:YjbE family putative metal transport protein n=1 Tax=Caulobacter sp. 17J65-9 TaxID=2709382 RepID=UPI0013C8770C|nr:YjbE family putative metal transport protein [Caulobacter sp. 17J65-9]NEX93383.1 YjbE family putative metal transport protein [Caulobacter sp. 17J65-9]
MLDSLFHGDVAAQLSALFKVLMIDLVLAGDNAVAVGLAAAGLPHEQRKKVILWGLGAAVILRIAFALITTQLLGLIGLLLAGGVLLLWVCWKMWRELREQGREAGARGEAALEDATGVDVNCSGAMGGAAAVPAKQKTFRQAFLQIFIADLSMSLDNVLAVAGAAREHPGVLVFGLLLSIALMGVAATWIAKLLHKHRWIGFLGLFVVLYVALHMIWEGHRQVVVDLGRVEQYNAFMPDLLDIGPAEKARFMAH